MKSPVPTAAKINEAHKLARQSAETAVEHAIQCGKMLAQMKESLGHGGGFDKWVEKHCQFAYSTARLYIKAAEQNANALAFSSLRTLFPSGTSAKPRELSPPPHSPGAAKPKSGDTQNAAGKPESAGERSPAPGRAEPTRDAPAPQAPHENRSGVTIESAGESHAASAQPGASLVDSDPELPTADEMAEMDAAIDQEYSASIAKVMESDDKLTAANAEIKRQAAEIATLKVSRDGFMSGKEAVTKLLKSEQRKVERLEKKLKAAEDELGSLRERIAVMEAAA